VSLRQLWVQGVHKVCGYCLSIIVRLRHIFVQSTSQTKALFGRRFFTGESVLTHAVGTSSASVLITAYKTKYSLLSNMCMCKVSFAVLHGKKLKIKREIMLTSKFRNLEFEVLTAVVMKSNYHVVYNAGVVR
jgi:hypothetical protein